MELLPAFGLAAWTYRGHPASVDTLIAQNTAKRNLDFGKRAQKSAMLSGGVVRHGVFSSTVGRQRHKNGGMSIHID